MSCYVDKARNKFGRMTMCHLIADSPEELHAMAESIGMRREWFQDHKFPHYDVSLTRRAEAIRRGTVELTRKDFVSKMRQLREEQPEFYGRPLRRV